MTFELTSNKWLTSRNKLTICHSMPSNVVTVTTLSISCLLVTINYLRFVFCNNWHSQLCNYLLLIKFKLWIFSLFKFYFQFSCKLCNRSLIWLHKFLHIDLSSNWCSTELPATQVIILMMDVSFSLVELVQDCKNRFPYKTQTYIPIPFYFPHRSIDAIFNYILPVYSLGKLILYLYGHQR